MIENRMSKENINKMLIDLEYEITLKQRLLILMLCLLS